MRDSLTFLKNLHLAQDSFTKSRTQVYTIDVRLLSDIKLPSIRRAGATYIGPLGFRRHRTDPAPAPCNEKSAQDITEASPGRAERVSTQ